MFQARFGKTLLLAVALGSAPVAAQTVQVGATPAHEFTSPVLNGMGVNCLEDLRGRPVFIEFWGTR